MSLDFAIEPIGPIWHEFLSLARLHWDASQHYRRHDGFAPSFTRYDDCNRSGFLRFCSARQDGVLVGYLIFYVTPSMHSQTLMVVEDTFFLHPSVRHGRNALRMLQFFEARCYEWGVQEVLASCEIDNTSGIGRLLEHLDYQPVVVQYSKHLTADLAVPSHADSGTSTVHEVSDVSECPSTRS